MSRPIFGWSCVLLCVSSGNSAIDNSTVTLSTNLTSTIQSAVLQNTTKNDEAEVQVTTPKSILIASALNGTSEVEVTSTNQTISLPSTEPIAVNDTAGSNITTAQPISTNLTDTTVNSTEYQRNDTKTDKTLDGKVHLKTKKINTPETHFFRGFIGSLLSCAILIFVGKYLHQKYKQRNPHRPLREEYALGVDDFVDSNF